MARTTRWTAHGHAHRDLAADSHAYDYQATNGRAPYSYADSHFAADRYPHGDSHDATAHGRATDGYPH